MLALLDSEKPSRRSKMIRAYGKSNQRQEANKHEVGNQLWWLDVLQSMQ